MRRGLAVLALAISVATACKSQRSASDTLISVEVWSDLAVPTELDSVRVDVNGQIGSRSKTFLLAPGDESGKTKLPAQLDLVPLAAKDATFTVKATGLLRQTDVVTQVARVSFIPGQALLLKLFLGRDCKSVTCLGDYTCANGACNQPIAIPHLPTYDPSQPLVPPDASLGFDGSAAVDTSQPDSGGTVDSGIALRDSQTVVERGTDLPVSDTGSPDGQEIADLPWDAEADQGADVPVATGGAGGDPGAGGASDALTRDLGAGGEGGGMGVLGQDASLDRAFDAPVGGAGGGTDGGAGGLGGTGGTASGGGGGSGGIGGASSGGTGGSTGGTGGSSENCPGTLCGSTCTNLDTDVNNCGACGRQCQSTNTEGLSCHAGLCDTPACFDGWANCTQPTAPLTDDGCESHLSAMDNCGACGHRCAPGQHCSGKTCVCDGTSCGGCCSGNECIVSANQRDSQCGTGVAGGTCGACTTGQHCSGGKCACDRTSCPSGCCNGTVCELGQTVLSCGTAGAACVACTGSGAACQGGVCCASDQAVCSGTCVNLLSDNANCGECGLSCTPVSPSVAAPCAAGHCLVTLASSQNGPQGIAVDSTSVYWTNFWGGTVMKLAKGGGSPTTLASGQSSPGYVAVDTTGVYWTNVNGGTVLKVSTAGGTPTTLASGRNLPAGIVVDATSVYWTDVGGDGTVMKVAKGGGTPTTLATNSGHGSPFGIAVDANNVYWTNEDLGTVMKVATGGGTPTTLASGQGWPAFIAVDATSVYWTITPTVGPGNTVMKVAISGGTPTTLASGQSWPRGIAADGTSVYWVNNNDNSTVMKVAIGGGTPTTVASGQNNPWSIAVDATAVYWTNEPTDRTAGAVMKLAPK